MRRALNNKGISLAEIMVASAIFLMMATGFYAALAAGDSSWQTNSVKIEVQQNLRTAMEAMIYELREAGPSSIEDPTKPLPDLIPPIEEVTTTDTQMTFQLPEGIKSNGRIKWEDDQIRFVRGGTDGNDLLRQTLTSGVVTATKTVTQNITSLEFTRSSIRTDEVSVDITAMKETNKGQEIQLSLTFVLQARN